VRVTSLYAPQDAEPIIGKPQLNPVCLDLVFQRRKFSRILGCAKMRSVTGGTLKLAM
jgi:hypothetical protein